MLAGLGALALYAVAAAVALWIAHRLVLPLRRRSALILAAAPLLLTGKAFLTGGVYAPLDILYDADPFGAHRVELGVAPDRTPTLGDVAYLSMPGRVAVRSSVRRGAFPSWNAYVLAGDPLLAMQQPAVLHPFTALGLTVPLPQAWTFDAALRLFLALLSGYLFFFDLVSDEAAALFGAVAWGFSDYVLFFQGFPHGLAVAPFPLLLLGLRRLARRADRRATGLTVAALLLMLLAGHPETLLHAVAGGGLYFLFELAGAPRHRRWPAVRNAVAAGAISLGLAAPLLLPLAESLPLTAEHAFRKSWYARQKRSVPLPASLRQVPPQLAPYSVGVPGHGRKVPGLAVPTSYAGSLVLVLAATGLFAGRNRERWFFLGLGGLTAAVCIGTPAADGLARLPLFDIAINEYSIFLATASLCALSTLGVAALAGGRADTTFVRASLLTAGVLAVLYARYVPRLDALGMPAAYSRGRFLLQIVFPLAASALFLPALRNRRVARAAPAILVVLLAAQRLLEAGSLYPTMAADTWAPRFAVLDGIPRGRPYRFAGVGMTLLPNTATLYGLEDVRGYEGMRLGSLVQTFPLWSVSSSGWFNQVEDPTRPFLSFLNVRWVLEPIGRVAPAGWRILATSDRVRLVENPQVLERAFLPRSYRGESDEARRLDLLHGISDYGEQGVVAGDTGGAWVTNGRGSISIERYEPERMVLRLDARDSALVGTSLVNWPGWKVAVDGTPAEVLAYNHAFVGFRVPPGVHEVVVRYAPDSVLQGAALAAATALLATALSRRRPRGVRSEPSQPESGSATTTD